jgi:hypothetical protein
MAVDPAVLQCFSVLLPRPAGSAPFYDSGLSGFQPFSVPASRRFLPGRQPARKVMAVVSGQAQGKAQRALIPSPALLIA